MISYEPFWSTLKSKNISLYRLCTYFQFSPNLFKRMKRGEVINLSTLNKLCLILDCKVNDIIEFIPSDEELADIKKQKELIASLRCKKNKKK